MSSMNRQVIIGGLVGLGLLGFLTVNYFHLIPPTSTIKSPTFAEYSAHLSTQKIAILDLKSDPLGAEYKTVISEAYKEGINFGGHYVIATWGCGTNCRKGVIVDTDTGKILGELPFVTENGESFVATSTLFIENPPEEQQGVFEVFPSRYWRWEPDYLIFVEMGGYIVSDKGVEVAPPPKGKHTDPEWMWNGDCQVIDNMTVC